MSEKKNVPKLRFPEFTEPWEQRKLGEICERITRKNKGNESDLPLTIASQYGLIDQRDFFNKVVAAKDMTNYYLLKKGEFAYNKSYSNGFDYGSIKRLNEYEKGCLSTLYVCFDITSDEVDSDYLECFFDTLNWYHDVATICAEGARNHGLLNVDVKAFFTDVKISLPLQKEEQKRITECFQQVDTLITLHQRKLDHVKDLKKSMLQKMFPKNGQLYPEVRFPEFTDAWEQRKLGDVLVLLKDGTHGTHKDSESGPLLLSAKNIKNGTIQWDESDRRISEDEYNNIHSNFKLQKGDVLLTIVGSIGETAILSQSKGVTFQRSVAFLRPSDKISSEFLYSEIQGQKFQKALNVRKSTSAQPGIYLGDLGTIPIEFPTSDEEQMQIGSYFQNLDNLITLHQRELDHLKLLKKGMLQQMFV